MSALSNIPVALQVLQCDITALVVDAVVNAANPQLAGGGGVDGAIHRAAGADVLHAACRKIGGCETGKAVLTPGFGLPAQAIIHTVGPIWRGGDQNEEILLRSCYANSLRIAQAEGFSSIAFPAISCGVYGYPAELAVKAAVDEVYLFLAQDPFIQHLIFACFDAKMAQLYRQEIKQHDGCDLIVQD